MKLELSKSYITENELFLSYQGKFYSYKRVISIKPKPKKKKK